MAGKKFKETLNKPKSIRFTASEVKGLNKYCERNKLRFTDLVRQQTLKVLEL